MSELVEVDEVPDSAIENGSDIEFIDNDTLLVKWRDDDGTLYSEEFTRNNVQKAVPEVDA